MWEFSSAHSVSEAVPLPVVDLETVLEVAEHIGQILDIHEVSHIDGAAGLAALAALGHDVSQVAVEVIAAAGAHPEAEVGAELVGQLGRGVQLIGELGVELPEAGLVQGVAGTGCVHNVGVVVVDPAVVDDIGVQRTDLSLVQLLIDLDEGLQDALVVDKHHVVEPGVVLDAELGGSCDGVDVLEEVGLDDLIVGAAGGTGHGLPGNVLAVGGQLVIRLKPLKALAGVVADVAGALLDLVIRLGELTAEEHALDVHSQAHRND